jgi:hypothetical protein
MTRAQIRAKLESWLTEIVSQYAHPKHGGPEVSTFMVMSMTCPSDVTYYVSALGAMGPSRVNLGFKVKPKDVPTLDEWLVAHGPQAHSAIRLGLAQYGSDTFDPPGAAMGGDDILTIKQLRTTLLEIFGPKEKSK